MTIVRRWLSRDDSSTQSSEHPLIAAVRPVPPTVGGPSRTARNARTGLAVFAVVAAMAVMSSCLGPNEVDPTGTAPFGNLELAVGDGASIRLVGWVIDPDTAAPIDVTVSVQAVAVDHRADLQRADVAAAYPAYGAAHGFDIRTPPLPPGPNQVCIWAENVGRGTQDRSLGCLDVVTGSDDAVGSFDWAGQSGLGRLQAAGWGYDAESSGSVDVIVSVDGVEHRVTANQNRPDVAAWAKKAGNYGFVADLPAVTGAHNVCVTVENVGRGGSAGLGCKWVYVNDLPLVGPGEGVSSVQAVGPAPGNPLVGIDRDGGISTTLRDGSTLWLFGDSGEPRVGGGHRYFVNNTAAWAAPGEPTVTRDAVASGNVPYTFVTPAAGFIGGCPGGFVPVMWPLSATTRAIGSIDRVTAFFGNVCLDGTDARSRGVAVVEWDYSPGQFGGIGAVGPQLQGRVAQQNLFPVGAEYGTASMMEGGLLYAYECGRPSDDQTGVIWPSDPAYTGCTVARVDPASASDPTAWRYWNGSMSPNWTAGSNWVVDPAAAGTMTIPGAGADKQLPVSSLSVVNDPTFGRSMVYSPWPGYTREVFVRTATSPVGPWSARTLINLPGCSGEWADGAPRYCYAATAQPWRSQPGQLGIGFYDQYVAANPVRGAYFGASAPFAG